MVLVVGDHQLHAVDVLQRFRILVELIEVRAHLAAAEHADLADERSRIVSGILERFPARLQKHTMLRIGQRRVARRKAEKPGIEFIDVVEHRRCIHIAGQARDLIWNSGRPHLVRRERRDRLDAIREIVPELIEIVRPRKPSAHADNCDRLGQRARHAVGRRVPFAVAVVRRSADGAVAVATTDAIVDRLVRVSSCAIHRSGHTRDSPVVMRSGISTVVPSACETCTAPT